MPPMCHRNPNNVKNGLQWKTWIQKSYTHTRIYTCIYIYTYYIYIYMYIYVCMYIYIIYYITFKFTLTFTLHYITLHYITYIYTYMRHRSVVWSLRSPRKVVNTFHIFTLWWWIVCDVWVHWRAPKISALEVLEAPLSANCAAWACELKPFQLRLDSRV